ARRAERGLARRQLVAGWRDQGHLGTGGLTMLSRTADHLFWMARYMERAENTARMLDVNYQTALLPQSADAAEKGWKGLLSISELTQSYHKRHPEVNAREVMRFMVSEGSNSSSILSCLRAARENARA